MTERSNLLKFLCKIEQFEITLLKDYSPDKQVRSAIIYRFRQT